MKVCEKDKKRLIQNRVVETDQSKLILYPRNCFTGWLKLINQNSSSILGTALDKTQPADEGFPIGRSLDRGMGPRWGWVKQLDGTKGCGLFLARIVGTAIVHQAIGQALGFDRAKSLIVVQNSDIS